MNIDQLSKLVNLNGLQGVQGLSGSKLGVNNDSSFALKLKELTQNMTTENPTKTVNSNISNNNLINSVAGESEGNVVNGLDGLSLQPQKMLQMMQLLSSNNSSSSSNSLISSDNSDDSSDDDSDDGVDSVLGSGTDMSQIIEAMIENQNQNINKPSENNLNSSDTSDQQNTINTKNNKVNNA